MARVKAGDILRVTEARVLPAGETSRDLSDHACEIHASASRGTTVTVTSTAGHTAAAAAGGGGDGEQQRASTGAATFTITPNGLG